MALHKITKGLDLPLAGEPKQEISPSQPITKVALIGADYVGMKPRMLVQEGDTVRRGQALFEDRKLPGVFFTAPAAGQVVAIHRGDRRVFQSLVIRLSDHERAGVVDPNEHVTFAHFSGKDVSALSGDAVKNLLLESGLWTAMRARPFGRVADPAIEPYGIFVTAMDTQPHAVAAEGVLATRQADFTRGLVALAKLTKGQVFVCTAPKTTVTLPAQEPRVVSAHFAGPHPAGSPGLHIHMLAPVHRKRTVWHVGYQDVIAMGRLFQEGRLDVERVISIAGPVVKSPRLVRTRLGASIDELVANGLNPGENRVISGSVLAGRTAAGDVMGYLGRYHLQIAALAEGREREFLGWMSAGLSRFSVLPIFVSRLLGRKRLSLNTSTNGSERAMVPIGMYERVMPFDLLPTFLLRALIMGDVERAEQLGCLELDEDDLALCTFVCPGKTEYGPLLRKTLDVIEREG